MSVKNSNNKKGPFSARSVQFQPIQKPAVSILELSASEPKDFLFGSDAKNDFRVHVLETHLIDGEEVPVLVNFENKGDFMFY